MKLSSIGLNSPEKLISAPLLGENKSDAYYLSRLFILILILVFLPL